MKRSLLFLQLPRLDHDARGRQENIPLTAVYLRYALEKSVENRFHRVVSIRNADRLDDRRLLAQLQRLKLDANRRRGIAKAELFLDRHLHHHFMHRTLAGERRVGIIRKEYREGTRRHAQPSFRGSGIKLDFLFGAVSKTGFAAGAQIPPADPFVSNNNILDIDVFPVCLQTRVFTAFSLILSNERKNTFFQHIAPALGQSHNIRTFQKVKSRDKIRV